jgi:HAE1 family hydrophobic/amphiphilic exporter-1
VKVIENAIRYPVTTAVGVILLVMFGAIALTRIPIQLTPDVQEPQVNVTTIWPGASPLEIEREIVDEQEEQLKSLEGLVEMKSSSMDGVGSINLKFQVGTDTDSSLLKVSNRLEQVPSYPEDVEKPIIRSSDPNAGAIAWFTVQAREEAGFQGDVSTMGDFCDDFVKPELERVPGVAASVIHGGREREMQVLVNPAKLAARQVTLNELAAALERENRNYSGGDFDEGKRRYIVRTVGEYESAEDIENIVIAVRNGVPVYLKDVARAELGFRKPLARVFERGNKILAMNAVKEPGSNVLEVMRGVRETVGRLNAGRLKDAGLEMIQVYDETDYVVSAISLVRQSLLIGGTLAILVLLLYLRSGTSTLVIAVAIPISIVGSFLLISALGRTINVVSLAGMAFAVGMVVDNSIVVLENIYRHRQMGKRRFEAALHAAREVWGAVLASTLTTIAVFVPVVFIVGEVGQLFGDIAIAISCAVGLSLIVSITVIPSLSARILGTSSGLSATGGHSDLWGGVALASRFTRLVSETVHWITGSTTRRLAVVLGLTVVAVGLSWLMMPQTEYLPTGNQNFMLGFFLPPPGYSLDEVAQIGDVFYDELRQLWETPAGESAALPGGGLRDFWFVALNNFAFLGASAREELRAGELLGPFQAAVADVPGGIFVIRQAGLFEEGLEEGRAIDVELTGPDLERLLGLGLRVFMPVRETLPGAQARPIPALDLGNPEVQVRTHRRRAAELGISNRELGFAVNALIDGARASDYQYQGKEIDLVVKAEEGYAHRTQLLEQLPIATPDGRLVTLGSVADVSVVNGPVEIDHIERQRAVTIRVTPGERMALESAMTSIEHDILGPLREAGELGGLYRANLSGSAAKLKQTWDTLKWNFLLALVITYLLMAALFESFLYPFVIMFSVPLAALGGFLGLRVMNLFQYQALDVLTMLGFIILIGTVVNNAILIVHQSLNHMRHEQMSPREAIRDSVRVRIRPIFMSVSTSVFAMLPLVLFPGAGSELYRGLGSVVVGGLIVSTLFTIFLVPAVFSLSLDARAAVSARLRGLLRPDDPQPAPERRS